MAIGIVELCALVSSWLGTFSSLMYSNMAFWKEKGEPRKDKGGKTGDSFDQPGRDRSKYNHYVYNDYESNDYKHNRYILNDYFYNDYKSNDLPNQ